MRRRGWFALLALLAGCASNREREIVVDGSATAFPIVNILAEDYGAAHPKARVVANKSGTGGGFQKLARGEIDVAAASRLAEPGEAPGAIAVPFAYDGVTVVVNPENPLRSLSGAQLRAVWSGAVDDWSELGGPPGRIAFYGPTENHGTHAFFAAAVGGLRRDVQEDQDYNVVVRDVAEDPQGIGYLGFDYYGENRDRLRAVAIDGVLPTEATVASGAYRPLTRKLYLYVGKRSLARPEVRSFVRFALGPKGWEAAMEARYVALPAAEAEAARRRVAE